MIQKLFVRDTLSKCALQQHTKGWELLRDRVFILVNKRHFFAAHTIWWETDSEEMTGMSHGKDRGRKDGFCGIKS